MSENRDEYKGSVNNAASAMRVSVFCDDLPGTTYIDIHEVQSRDLE